MGDYLINISLTMEQAETAINWLATIARIKPYAMSEQTSEILSAIVTTIETAIDSEQ